MKISEPKTTSEPKKDRFVLICASCGLTTDFRLTAPAPALANVMRKRHREDMPDCTAPVLSIHLGWVR